MKKETVLKEAVKQWGVDAQCAVAIEEMAELIKELIKLKRADYRYSAESIQPLIEEVAAVRLMIEQVIYMFDISTDDIDDISERKLNKIAGRLGLK